VRNRAKIDKLQQNSQAFKLFSCVEGMKGECQKRK